MSKLRIHACKSTNIIITMYMTAKLLASVDEHVQELITYSYMYAYSTESFPYFVMPLCIATYRTSYAYLVISWYFHVTSSV